MAVAKTYENWEVQGKPFTSNGREYVNVVNPKNSSVKTVRWYSDKEYARMYKTAIKDDGIKRFKTQKQILGFENGYITIFKGENYEHLDWFRASVARFARPWGWYIVSTDEIPDDMPAELETVRLEWADVGNEDGSLRPEDEVKHFCDGLRFEPGASQYQGRVGERIERTLTVDKAIPLEGTYGFSTLHVMSDAEGNIYTWCTASKSWAVGSVKKIRGTVKDHRLYQGSAQTVLTRCTEVK